MELAQDGDGGVENPGDGTPVSLDEGGGSGGGDQPGGASGDGIPGPRKRRRSRGAGGGERAALDAPVSGGVDCAPPIAVDINSPVPRKRASKAPAIDEETVGWGVCALFGTVAFVTGHGHWVRTPAQASPITEPLCRLLERLPAAQKKAILEMVDPVALTVGLCQVAGPSVTEEVALARWKASGGRLRVEAQVGAPDSQTAGHSNGTTTGAMADPAKVNDPTGIFN